MRRSMRFCEGASTRKRSEDGSAFVRPIEKCSTSKRAPASTTASKICSMMCESMRWPWASTTSESGTPARDGCCAISGMRKEQRQAFLAGVAGTVSVLVIHVLDINTPRTELRIRDLPHRELAFVHGGHQAGFMRSNGVVGHRAERSGDHRVQKIGGTAAQVVGKIADDRLSAGFFHHFVA